MERETELTHGNGAADENKKELGNANSELQWETCKVLVIGDDDVFSSDAFEISEERTLGMNAIMEDSELHGKEYCLVCVCSYDDVFSSDAFEISEERTLDMNAIMEDSELRSRPPREMELRASFCRNGWGISEDILAMNGIMKSLTDADAVIIGVYGPDNAIKVDVVERVTRRVHRDNLFDKVIKVNVTRKPKLKRIQGELATALGFTMKEKSKTKRAALLRDRIKREQKILVVLQDVNRELDLGKLGIPFGDDHTGCKILLTSMSQEILSNHMHAHRVIEAPH